MKILFISNSRMYGGAEYYALRIAGALKERGVPIHVVTAPGTRLAVGLRRAGLSTEEADVGTAMGRGRGYLGTLALLDLLATRRLKKLLHSKREAGFDTLVLHDLREQILATRYASELGFRVVWIVVSPLHYVLHRVLGYRLLRLSSLYADAIIVVCQYLKEQLEIADLPKECIKVASGFVDTLPVGLEPKPVVELKRIGYLGRLTRGKGLETLLEAIALIAPTMPVEVIIAGEGPLRGRLDRLSRVLGISQIISFAGFVSDPLEFIASLDIFVNPSRDPGEAAPNNILEAFSVGRPVVASDHAGITELVRNNETGLLVPKSDPQALAKALLRLVEQPTWANCLGQAAKRSLTPRYLKTTVVDQLVKFIGGPV